LNSGEGERVAAMVRLASCMKTESRVKMLLALKSGASRPLDVVKRSGENPSTLYRIVDEMIDAGVVERTEPAQGEVHWRLTEQGARLLGSIESLAFPGPAPAKIPAKKPSWIYLVVPAIVILISGVQAARQSEAGYIVGGLVLALASYLVTRWLLK
jgi:DNA-binding MarR family transcriptional regulator